MYIQSLTDHRRVLRCVSVYRLLGYDCHLQKQKGHNMCDRYRDHKKGKANIERIALLDRIICTRIDAIRFIQYNQQSADYASHLLTTPQQNLHVMCVMQYDATTVVCNNSCYNMYILQVGNLYITDNQNNIQCTRTVYMLNILVLITAIFINSIPSNCCYSYIMTTCHQVHNL